MHVTRWYPTIDAPDLEAETAFWAAVLGGAPANADSGEFGQWRDVIVDGRVVLGIQHVPDLVAPTWPDPQVPQQTHLDVYVEATEVEDASAELVRLGARELDVSQSPDAVGHGFRVYADPAGHPFCLCWG